MLKFKLKSTKSLLSSLNRLEEYSKAIEKLTETYHINPNFQEALISRGNVYVDLGHKEAFAKAQRDYELVLLREEANVDAQINMAYLYQMTGRFKRAWDQFSTAMKLKSSMQIGYYCTQKNFMI